MIDRLLALAHDHPSAPFVLHEDESYDFGCMADNALRGAAWLATQGISPGDHVVVAVANRPLFLFYWFALAARGAVAVPVAHDIFGESLRYVAGQSRSRLLLAQADDSARLAADLGGLSLPVVAFQGESAFLAELARHAPAAPHDTPDHWPVSILYTSGTTGQPKGAVIPNKSYTAIGRKIVEAIGITRRDRILTFLPLHHANPQMYSVMSVLTAGCSIALAPRFSASQFLAQAERYQATGFTYVGTVLSILAKEIASPVKSTIRWCVGGGAPLAVWQDLAAKLDVMVHELYGMTETGGMVTINTRERHRLGSVGQVRDDFAVVLLDDADRILGAGIGEIAVRPREPFVMTTGYFDKPEETLGASANLWFHTGDLGRFDEDGFLHFAGRKKELIRRGGEMISPVAIELAALKHPAIADCAAVGVKDEILEEDIKLVVVRRSAVEPREIVSFLAGVLPRHMLPRYFDFVAAIPKTPTQKVQRFKMTSNSPSTIDVRKGP